VALSSSLPFLGCLGSSFGFSALCSFFSIGFIIARSGDFELGGPVFGFFNYSVFLWGLGDLLLSLIGTCIGLG